jgi:ubiquitin carboxyl-terminal hydrolase MINDY-1/2
VSPGSLVALFRSSHLSVLYKSPSDGSLYTLVSDSVFLHESSVVWERLEDVDGGWSSFVDGDFIKSHPVGGDFAGETAESTLRAFEAETGQFSVVDPSECVPA